MLSRQGIASKEFAKKTISKHSVLRWVLTFNIFNMKKHMFLTPEFEYESHRILDFFPHNYYPKPYLSIMVLSRF